MAPKRFYDDTRWKRLRLAFLKQSPLCEDCRLRGRVTAASHVDHKVPLKDAPERGLDWSNLAALCGPCHSSKTATSDGGLGHRRRQRYVKGCGLDGMPVDPRHPWYQADRDGEGRS